MPGIHVHTLSQLDWIDQEKESLLTVPGSYWLCNKKNIYKFIFKYHRTTKNTTQFLYGKELLKIIRRIIKCHPSQGQQFGTQHLLVTYNCTSWTRQDKMFAILKFQRRTSAATFSHAFVLTIKICPSSEEESLYDLKYPIVTEVHTGAALKDSDDTADNDEKATTTVIHTDKMSPRKLRTCPSKRINQILKHSKNTLSETSEASVNSTLQNDIMEKSAKQHARPNGRAKNATTCTVTKEDFTDKCKAELHDSMYVNKLTNCNSRTSEKDTELNPIAHRQDQLRIAKRKNEIQEVEKMDDGNKEAKLVEIQRQHQEAPKNRKYQILSSSKSSSTEIIKDDYNVDKRLLLDKNNFDEDSMRHENAADDKANSADNDDIEESIVDSSKISNRYFIKKDINNANQYRASARSTSSLLAVDKSMQGNSQQDTSEANNANEKLVGEKANEEFTRRKQGNETADKSSDKRLAPSSTRAIDDGAQSSTCSKSCRVRKQRSREFSERKTVADDKVLRSSNITDLVMEGLMFTIRQDQDSVAVIEQKTKLEVDEVLENSEKVETEAGEKCLLNSSLLRLENLITMIDPPRDKDEQHRANHSVIGNSTHSSPTNVSNTTCHLNDVDYVDETTSKLSISNYERCSLMDQSSPPRFGWQQQRACSTVANNGNYSANKNTMEKLDQSMDWEVDDHDRHEEYIHQNDVQIINEEEKEDIEEMEDEEEDIIPEVFHSTIFSETNADPPSTELLMDDIDIEETYKLDTSIKNHDDSPPAFSHSSSSNKVPMSETLVTSEKTRLTKRVTNVPRVISNKAITVEQIPLALQKILRHTRAFSLARTAYETSIAHNDKEEMQSTTSTESAASETNAPSNPYGLHRQQQHSDITNSDSHSTDRSPVEKSELSMKSENDDQRDEECTKNASLQRNRDINPDIANESVIKITDNTEKTRNEDKETKTRNEDKETKTRNEDKETKTRNEDKETKTRNEDKETKTRNEDKKTKTRNEDEPSVMIDLEDAAKRKNSDAIKEKNNKTRRSSRTKTRARHDSPRKLQDITDDFYHDLRVHNENNAIQQRCLRQRYRSLNNPEDIKNNKVRIEMLKFIQDITGGVKVVVRRLNINNRPSLLKKEK